jgi:hypothetical protein
MILRNGKFSGKILREIFYGKFSTSHHYLSEMLIYTSLERNIVVVRNPEVPSSIARFWVVTQWLI